VKAPPQGGRSCGALGCLLFDTPEAAFAHVLQAEPDVLAIGEAHPLRGAESVEPASRRFANALLPLLRPRATDLVIELLLPNPACRKETVATARKEQKVVTEGQADTAQNDFVALGHRAKAQRAQPHALKPTCEDLERIAAGGDEAVAESLAIVTRLTEELVRNLLDARRRTTDKPLIVTYGGALHNDLAPRAGREQWSFGPALERLTSGRYVELDLIVPEFVKDSDAWRALPWYGAYDPEAHPTETTLFNPSPRSYVLIFPRSEARASAPGG
jgi:hypothetical protein